jgi:probable HAF family extracellular repeat protein
MRKNSLGARLLALCAFLVLCGSAIAKTQAWTILDLGANEWGGFPGNAVNNRGDVAGWMFGGTTVPNHHGYIWNSGTLTDLGVPAGSFASGVQGMNNHGTLAGDTNERPAVYKDGSWTVLPVFGALNDVNEADVAVGAMLTGGGGGVHAFIYKDGLITDIGAPPQASTVAWAINNGGTIVGNAFLPPPIPFTFPQPIRGFVYENGAMRLLDTLGGLQAFAMDINNSGTIVGTAQEANGNFHAVTYVGSTPLALGVPGNFSTARAINDRGQIVGTMDNGSYLYDNGTVTRLESIPEVMAAGWTRLTPTAINDRGWIVGTGFNGQGRAFVLIPH